VRQVFVERSLRGRRTGAIMLVDADGKLSGIFTDSYLARLFEGNRDAAIDRPICEVMTSRPCTVPQGAMMLDAVAVMAERKISELPVIDAEGKPQGMIDITDVVGLFPEAALSGAGEPAGPTLARFARGTTGSNVAAKFPPRECA
jgi:arabinose-5-phosphate isomerase